MMTNNASITPEETSSAEGKFPHEHKKRNQNLAIKPIRLTK
jgi:hypothetical protein